MEIDADLVDRFWQKVDKGSSDSCWEWMASKRNGYGCIGKKHKLISSHRLSWMIHFGEIPDGLFVCHHCDNRSCVNPSHLFLGTPSDNAKDAYNKGRLSVPETSRFKSGESNPQSKLTQADVDEIRELRNRDGLTLREIANRFNVDHSLVWQISKGKRWATAE